jgi:hypothetical protein
MRGAMVLRPSISISISYISKNQTIGKKHDRKKNLQKSKRKNFQSESSKKIQDFRKQETRKKESLSVIWKRE